MSFYPRFFVFSVRPLNIDIKNDESLKGKAD